MIMDRREYQKAYQKEYNAHKKRVNLVFSEAEYGSLSRQAKASGEGVATYVKRRALEAHHGHMEAMIPEELQAQLTELDRVIRTIANNMNQVAHHSNRVRQVLDETEPFLYIRSLEVELKKAIALCTRHDSGNSS